MKLPGRAGLKLNKLDITNNLPEAIGEMKKAEAAIAEAQEPGQEPKQEPLQEPQKEKLQESAQVLVKHAKTQKCGLIISKSKNHKDYFLVLCEGSLEEWYISNIDGY